MTLRKISGLAAMALAAAFLALTFVACTTDPEDASKGELDGAWLFTQVRWSLTEDGFTVTDSVNFDTANVFTREFYYIRDGLLFWVLYVPESEMAFSRVAPIRKLDGKRWLLGQSDTMSVSRSGDRMTMVQAYRTVEYDDWLEDSVRYESRDTLEFVLYPHAFPPDEWYAPAPKESEPNNSRGNANALEVDGRPLVASLVEEDVDWYSFQAEAGQAYLIRTYGSTDTYMELYRGATMIDENDDYSDGNAGIYWVCGLSGTYHVRITGYSDSVEGNYSISVYRADDEYLLKSVSKSRSARLHPMRKPVVK